MHGLTDGLSPEAEATEEQDSSSQAIQPISKRQIIKEKIGKYWVLVLR